jgi:hypothetical protein
MSWPSWFRIVMDPELGTGPTPAFILGGSRVPLSADALPLIDQAALVALLISMRDDTPAPYCIEILRCPRLRTFVASPRTSKPTGRVHLGGALYSCDVDGHDIHSVESLANALWTVFGDSMTKGRFSRRNGNWRRFDDDDLENIRTLLADPSPIVPDRALR